MIGRAGTVHLASPPYRGGSGGIAAAGYPTPAGALHRWICGQGGGTDYFCQPGGPQFSERLGQPLIIENRPGATSNIATEAAVRAPADGYSDNGLGYYRFRYNDSEMAYVVCAGGRDRRQAPGGGQATDSGRVTSSCQASPRSLTASSIRRIDHVLGQWSSWLEPLDNYPGAAELKAKMLPLARQSMTYNGKLYGLPYFTSYFGIVYNDKMMKAAGIAAPPKTYAEWPERPSLRQERRRRAPRFSG